MSFKKDLKLNTVMKKRGQSLPCPALSLHALISLTNMSVSSAYHYMLVLKNIILVSPRCNL